jgi:hypothetical protein
MRLSQHFLLLGESELAAVKSLRRSKGLFSGMMQWYLLKRALSHWRGRLFEQEHYSTIVRFRTDVLTPIAFKFVDCLGRDTNAAGLVYAQSDLIFYATPQTFFRIFLSMFDLSCSRYTNDKASVKAKDFYRRILNENSNFRPLCLLPSEYSPEPRERQFNELKHPLVLFNKTNESTTSLSADVNDHHRGLSVGGHKLTMNQKISIRKEKYESYFCGCKWGIGHPFQADRSQDGVGWARLTHNGKKFQSEPAMAYHIITRAASCLPLDVAHREVFEPMEGREQFSFGASFEVDDETPVVDEWAEQAAPSHNMSSNPPKSGNRRRNRRRKTRPPARN